MKQVIALSGPASTGKSHTIRRVYDLLLAKYPRAIVENRATWSWGIDLKILVTIDDVIIGFESRGDPNNRLLESLPEFAAVPCNVIVCATRTSGSTYDAVRALEGYEVVPFEQRWIPEDEHTSSNSKMAEKISEVCTLRN